MFPRCKAKRVPAVGVLYADLQSRRAELDGEGKTTYGKLAALLVSNRWIFCRRVSPQQAVVYAWDMHALRAFIKRRPLTGACLQKAISEDFVNKVDQSRGHKKRYRLLLEEALEGGEINVTEKKKLQRWAASGREGG